MGDLEAKNVGASLVASGASAGAKLGAEAATGQELTSTAPSLSRAELLQEQQRQSTLVAAVRDAYDAMHGGVFGAGVEQKQLLGAIAGKSNGELMEMAELYAEHYERDFFVDVLSELKSGDISHSVALHLFRSAWTAAGVHDEYFKKCVMDPFEKTKPFMDPEWRKQYTKTRGTTYLGMLNTVGDVGHGGWYQHEYVEALCYIGELSPAQLMYHSLRGPVRGYMSWCDVMVGMTRAEIVKLAQDYSQLRDLRGRRLNLFEDLKDGDRLEKHRRKVAAILVKGVEHYDIADFLPEVATPQDLSAQQREKFVKDNPFMDREWREKFERGWGQSYLEWIGERIPRGLVGTFEVERIETLIKVGHLSDIQNIFYDLHSKNSERPWEDVLGDKTAAEIAVLEADYRKAYGLGMAEDVLRYQSGSNRKNAEILLRGVPETPQVAVAVEREKFEHNNSGLGSWVLRQISDREAVTERTLERAEETVDHAFSDRKLTGEEMLQVSRFVQYGGQDVQMYAAAKDKVTDVASTTTAVVAVSAVVVVSGGTSTPVLIIMTTGTGAASYTGTKMAFAGRSYDYTKMGDDVFKGGFEGVIGSISGGVGNLAGQAGERLLARIATEGGEATLGTVCRSGTAAGAKIFIVDGATGAVTNATETFFREGVSGGWAKPGELVLKLRDSAIEGGVSEIVNIPIDEMRQLRAVADIAEDVSQIRRLGGMAVGLADDVTTTELKKRGGQFGREMLVTDRKKDAKTTRSAAEEVVWITNLQSAAIDGMAGPTNASFVLPENGVQTHLVTHQYRTLTELNPERVLRPALLGRIEHQGPAVLLEAMLGRPGTEADPRIADPESIQRMIDEIRKTGFEGQIIIAPQRLQDGAADSFSERYSGDRRVSLLDVQPRLAG